MPDQEREKYLKENIALKNEVSMLKEEMALMQSQLDWLKKQMFGRKTEQSSAILEGLSCLMKKLLPQKHLKKP